MGKFIPLDGMMFGRLTAIRRAGSDKSAVVYVARSARLVATTCAGGCQPAAAVSDGIPTRSTDTLGGAAEQQAKLLTSTVLGRT